MSVSPAPKARTLRTCAKEPRKNPSFRDRKPVILASKHYIAAIKALEAAGFSDVYSHIFQPIDLRAPLLMSKAHDLQPSLRQIQTSVAWTMHNDSASVG